ARIQSSPPWLAARRRAAWDAFEMLPMPSVQRDEDWRRTDVSHLHLDEFQPLDAVDPGFIEALRNQRDEAAPEAAYMVDAPGPAQLDGADALIDLGVLVCSLEDAARLHPELVQRAFACIGTGESKFAALWDALWRGGAF